MSEFKVGDKVLVDSNIVAEIQFFDPTLNIVRYVSRIGGAVNTITAPIRGGGAPYLQLLPESYEQAHVDAGNPPVDGAAGEVTTVTHPQEGVNVPVSTEAGAVDVDRLTAASKRTPKVKPEDQ